MQNIIHKDTAIWIQLLKPWKRESNIALLLIFEKDF